MNRLTTNPGRVAGLWYLLLVLLGPVRLIYIPDRLFVDGNAAATMNNIAANMTLVRLGVVTDLLAALVLIFLTLAFYRLFASVNRNLAILVVIFGGVMPALLDIVGVTFDLGAMTIIRNVSTLSAFDKPQQDALAVLLLKLRGNLITASEMLWGVWLLPLGALTYKSGFLPKVLGVWLVLGGIAYIVLCLTGILWP